MEILIPSGIFLLGLIFGSFLNVCIYRIPAGESIVTGRSHCTSCGTPIRPYDLVPVLSYLLLRGRCRACGKRISPRYPLIELLTGFLYLLLYIVYGLTSALLLYAAFVSALIVESFIDFDTQEIPDRISVFLIIIGTAACIFSPDIAYYERIIGFFAGGVPLLLAFAISREKMGFGDIKLAASAGLVLGYRLSILSLFLACVTGSVYGVGLMALQKKSFKTAIPFGPFLALGFILSLLFGNRAIAWYLSLITH